ncbi:energy transducer TonB family protein [Bradyrhizobium canariense]|uniref:energy transducer TonB family protein n=1 Tax=Bradyrhizobium canariense TaxID=255045 RepID=UPI0020135A9E|nr:energy transducer TonB [Bradyrhizobium canariense]
MRLAAHIASRTFFPPAAMGQTGEARVAFVMDRSGKLISRTLAESAGSQSLDAAALAIVERAQPFPEAPSELTESSFSFTVPIVFRGRQFQVPPLRVSAGHARLHLYGTRCHGHVAQNGDRARLAQQDVSFRSDWPEGRRRRHIRG